MKRLLLFSILAIFISNIALAKSINVGSGGPTGSYFSMMNDINSYCQQDIAPDTLNIINTGGSLGNLTGMTSKKYTIAPVQEDVLQFMAKQMPRKVNGNRQKAIAGLHLETAHLMIPFNYKPESSSSGWSNFTSLFTSDTKKPLSLSVLKGQKIASTGGSIVSLKALSYFLDLQLKIVELSMDKLLKIRKLPIFLVGGQPYTPVENILSSNKYALISIDYAKLKEKAPFYLEMQANYKVKGKIKTINTFAVRALLIGKSFRKKAKNETMSKLATCIGNNLGDLADDGDTNSNWETVYELEEKEGSQSGWPYFPLIEN